MGKSDKKQIVIIKPKSSFYFDLNLRTFFGSLDDDRKEIPPILT
jgi:hypothetical protein